ncbi:glutamine--fructose-6-phosphate transaminase (isomerizing) [Algiphilus sp.]|uniref:glutamine--fructose-6-phosphate transaminase (isomerizing) n=1 Tax=Algiphilus sp. TaxID=1872431 RepID=UPI003B51BE5D
MCGIVGASAQRNVRDILIEGLRRLEYRGYDSAGFAVVDGEGSLRLVRAQGKVTALAEAAEAVGHDGHFGIAHTRWATHGVPAEHNAHPHISGDVAVVHNGIIENHAALRAALEADGYRFVSDTDTEVVAHLLHRALEHGTTLIEGLQTVVAQLEGAYALAVTCARHPDTLAVARKGSPLTIGVGIGEHFCASDALALLPVTSRFVYLEEGDIAELRPESYRVLNGGVAVERPVQQSTQSAAAVEKGAYRHFMLKEIHEQPTAIAQTLEGRIGDGRVLDAILGPDTARVLAKVQRIHIVACGTSAHAGQVAAYWFEQIARMPCRVELASEFRYREPLIEDGTLIITISQSGETADTLEALRHARQYPLAGALAICNAPESSLVRESDLVLMTHAGPERSVASTKAFTTQLTALALVMLLMARRFGMAAEVEADYVAQLVAVPRIIEEVLELDSEVRALAERLVDKHHALFLGRNTMFPVALEGALKLKEISYIHAEAYAAGELKHGPLALVDEDMPVIAVAPDTGLLEKLRSNLQEVRARGGRLFVFGDIQAGFSEDDTTSVLSIPASGPLAHPLVYTVPLQLLAYHVAVLKGTDVDQPRNLAKSVTVE